MCDTLTPSSDWIDREPVAYEYIAGNPVKVMNLTLDDIALHRTRGSTLPPLGDLIMVSSLTDLSDPVPGVAAVLDASVVRRRIAWLAHAGSMDRFIPGFVAA